jgi:hypothetical protein
MAVARAMGRAARSTDGLLDGDAVEERERVSGETAVARARAMGRAARSPDGLVGGDAAEERERVSGGGGGGSGDAAAGQCAALEVLERDEAGGFGRGGEVAEDVLEEALVAGERDGARAGPRREPVLLLRLPEQLPEHGVVQVRRPHHEPPRRAAHAHRHVPRRDRSASRRAGPPPPQRLPQPHDVPDLAAAFRHVDARASERARRPPVDVDLSSCAVGLDQCQSMATDGEGKRRECRASW